MVLPKTVDRVIIVSGGPSAEQTYFGDAFEIRSDAFAKNNYSWVYTTIGVNHVVEKGNFDYWVTCDHVVFETASPRGWPILFGKSDWHQRITEGPQLDAWYAWPKIYQNDVHGLMPPPSGDVPTYSDLPRPCAQWNAFSGLAALGLVWILRPKLVDLFGFDMEGEGGAADEGHDLPRKRDAERWATETRIFRWWLGVFAYSGIMVRRHTLNGIEAWPMKEVEVGREGVS